MRIAPTFLCLACNDTTGNFGCTKTMCGIQRRLQAGIKVPMRGGSPVVVAKTKRIAPAKPPPAVPPKHAIVTPPAEIRIDLPGERLTNPLNGGIGNTKIAGIIRARDRESHRSRAYVMAKAVIEREGLPRFPLLIEITRVAIATMDDDGIAASAKATRDGIANAIGIDDGDPRLRFVYAQVKRGRGTYAVEIRISTRESACSTGPTTVNSK